VAIFTFGTRINPAHFVEVPDPLNVGQVIRPASGVTLLVQNAATLAPLPSITTAAYGYIPLFTTQDVPQIRVSVDGGNTWIGPLTAQEADTAAVTAGVDVTAASADAAAAVQTAETALASAATALDQIASLTAGGVPGGTTGGTGGSGVVVFSTDAEAAAAPPGSILFRLVKGTA
jgi:hypothetical protein